MVNKNICDDSVTDLSNAKKTKVCFLQIEGCVTITSHEKICGNENSNRVVNPRYLRRSKVVINKDCN